MQLFTPLHDKQHLSQSPLLHKGARSVSSLTSSHPATVCTQAEKGSRLPLEGDNVICSHTLNGSVLVYLTINLLLWVCSFDTFTANVKYRDNGQKHYYCTLCPAFPSWCSKEQTQDSQAIFHESTELDLFSFSKSAVPWPCRWWNIQYMGWCFYLIYLLPFAHLWRAIWWQLNFGQLWAIHVLVWHNAVMWTISQETPDSNLIQAMNSLWS